MEFGKTLREAREAKGYTVSQLAEMTHIMSHTITGLENDDFSAIAAPIYGRGFVKLCCQALGLDPKPMIDAFMTLYNGTKNAPEPAASAPIAPEPQPASPAIEPPSAPAATEPPPEPPLNDLFDRPVDPVESVKPVKPMSRFAPPQPNDEVAGLTPLRLPAIPWRLLLLLVGAIAVVWALVAGCGALYRALGAADEKTAKPVAPAVQPAKTAAAEKAPRTPKPVKPLYID